MPDPVGMEFVAERMLKVGEAIDKYAAACTVLSTITKSETTGQNIFAMFKQMREVGRRARTLADALFEFSEAIEEVTE